MVIGVLALQGDFEAHARTLSDLGATPKEVRTPSDLEGVDGLVIPGGESTTMTLGIEREALADPLRGFEGPILGTCAGMVMLDREHLAMMDVLARRNAFGRQPHSFETELEVEGMDGGPVHAVFIRAPWIEEHGPDVEVLAEVDGHPVAVREGKMLSVAFHPEIANEQRFHAWLVEASR